MGFGGTVGISPRTGGVGVGDTEGVGLIDGLGLGGGVMVGVGDGEVYFRVGSGDGPGPSANTAVALSSNKITTLSQISDLWVECAFMGVLLSS